MANEHNTGSSFALLFHHAGGRSWMTGHDVSPDGDGLAVGPGFPLRRERIRQLAGLLGDAGNAGFTESLLPNNLLTYGPQGMTWFVSGCQRPMWFRIAKHDADLEDMGDQSTRSLLVEWPSLIFRVSGRGFQVAAYCQTSRPRPTTLLYHCPLMNVYESGIVCLGSARAPQERGLSAIPRWEEIVFKVPFSHVNHERTFKSGDGVGTMAHLQRWRAFEKSGRGPRAADLVPMGRRLGDWIR